MSDFSIEDLKSCSNCYYFSMYITDDGIEYTCSQATKCPYYDSTCDKWQWDGIKHKDRDITNAFKKEKNA